MEGILEWLLRRTLLLRSVRIPRMRITVGQQQFSAPMLFFRYGAYLLKVDIIHKPGDVFIVVMSMLLGAYFLGLISPHLMVLLNARVSAATIYNTINRVGVELLSNLLTFQSL